MFSSRTQNEEMEVFFASSEGKKEAEEFTESLGGRIPFFSDTYGAWHLQLLRLLNGDDEEEVVGGEKSAKHMPPLMGAFVHTTFWAVTAMFIQVLTMMLLEAFMNSNNKDAYEKVNWQYFVGQPKLTNLVNATAMINYALDTKDKTFLGSTVAGRAVLAKCDADETVPGTLEIFLWIMGIGILNQMIEALGVIKHYIFAVHTDEATDVNYWQKDPADSNKRVVVWVSTFSKIVIILILKIPLVLTIAFVYMIGAHAMCNAGSVGLVVIKCLGVSLIGNLPGVIMRTFVDDQVQKMTANAAIAFPQEKTTFHWNWRYYAVPLLKAIVTVAFTLYFTKVEYGTIQKFRAACFVYENTYIKPECREEWHCGMHLIGSYVFNG